MRVGRITIHQRPKEDVLSEATLNTPYENTIPPSEQPAYPGDIELEKLYKEADKSLYRAKTRKHSHEDGLNCVAYKLMGV